MASGEKERKKEAGVKSCEAFGREGVGREEHGYGVSRRRRLSSFYINSVLG